jgi:hypothetical protein
MTDMSAEVAQDVISGHLLYAALDTALTAGLIDWLDYPDIGEHDWATVVRDARNKARVFESTKEQFQAAYTVLAARADGSVSS